MTSGSCCTSAGRPSAILRPNSIATTLSEIPHHHRHVVLDEQHGERRTRRGCAAIVSPSSSTSPWVSPAAGSSISRNRGRAASARAISSRFSVPNGSPAAGRNISGPRPSWASRSPATSRVRRFSRGHADPADRPDDADLALAVGADHHVLEQRHRREQGEVLERAGDAEAGDAVGRHGEQVLAVVASPGPTSARRCG